MNETSRELMHWGMQKGEKWDNHKYIARVETGKPGKFLYFYDMDKYNAWKNGAKSKLQDTAKGLKDKALNLKNKTQKQVKTSIAKAKDSVNVQSKKIAEQALRSKEQLSTAAKKYAKYISYDAKSKAEQVKNKLTKGEADTKKTVSSFTKTASDVLETGKRQAESMASAAQMSANMLSKKADEAMKNAKSMVDSAMKSGEKAAQHLTKEVSDFVKKTFSKESGWVELKGSPTQQGKNQNAVEKAKAFISNIAHSYVDALGAALYDAVNKPKKDTSPVIHANDGDGKYLAKLDYPNGDTRYIKNKDDWKRFAEVQKYQNNEREFMHSLPEIEVDENGKLPTKEQDTKEVNEKIWDDMVKSGSTNVIRSVNCVYCSTAYELRRRGYDVEAANLPSNVMATNISRVFDVKDSTIQTETKKIVSSVPINTGDTTYGRVTNRRLTDKGWEYTVTSYKLENHDKNIKSITPAVDIPDGFNTKAEDGSVNKEWKKNIESAIDQQTASFPENSRGMFNVYWKSGGGHSMVWEKDENGKIEIIDTQLGMKMPLDTILAEIDPAAPMQLIRTDNLKVNRGAMFRVVSN